MIAPPRKLRSIAALAIDRIVVSYVSMLASEMESDSAKTLVRATASLSAVTAPTPPDGDMTWIASPTRVTNGDGFHSDKSGVDEIIRMEAAYVSSCMSTRHRVESPPFFRQCKPKIPRCLRVESSDDHLFGQANELKRC